MSGPSVYPLAPSTLTDTQINNDQYLSMYQQSITDPEGFWREQGQCINWLRPYSHVKRTSFTSPVSINWYYDGTTNATSNCLDRHLASRGDETAIIWEPDVAGESETVSYRTLHQRVCRFANALKHQGITKGDVVIIYMPMVVDVVVAMLACCRIGAIHSVVFAGFSPQSLAGRINDCRAKMVITADEGVRGGRIIPLKNNVEEALASTTTVETVIVLKRTGGDVAWHPDRDLWWHDVTEHCSAHCPPVEMKAEDPLFILYTSGSTGKPKGVVHTTGGYLVYACTTFRYVFAYQPGEVFWCNADVGWITGHSYVVYGPLLNGATILLHEGVPNYPQACRLSQIIDKHRVNILYIAPTAIRTLMAEGDCAVEGSHRRSLRLLGSVGEPINPQAWTWYFNTIGEQRCPIVDTWWQTETGAAMLTPLPGATALKPGSVTRPFFGIQPALVDGDGRLVHGSGVGNLVMLDSWPGQARTLFNDHCRFEQTYFSRFAGMYNSGDEARRDEDGYYWITGRSDDVINVAGHRMGTAEIESAVVAHPQVAEAAAVGFPHQIKGQGIYVFVTLNSGSQTSEALKSSLKQWVRNAIGPIATPDIIQWAPGLPKTRSGKIMRRILRRIAAYEYDNLGDVSTLADPEVIDQLITNRGLAGN